MAVEAGLPVRHLSQALGLPVVEWAHLVQLLHIPQLCVLPLQGLLNGWSQSP